MFAACPLTPKSGHWRAQKELNRRERCALRHRHRLANEYGEVQPGDVSSLDIIEPRGGDDDKWAFAQTVGWHRDGFDCDAD
jgi:hypothetical protein